MKAITFTQTGSPDVLRLTDVALPTPGPEQLLVRVHATALNRVDLLQRRGKYPAPPGESEILGVEIAGEVTAMGENVTGFAMGDRVFGLVGGGAYAEYCVMDQFMAMPIPEPLSYTEAAAVPEAFLTANEAIFTLGQLQAGETILIHAGGSGVGSAAVQLAHAAGAVVYTTVSSPAKMAKVKALGAAVIIDYKQQDFKEAIHVGIDVIIDFVGASYLERHLQLLNVGGRLIQVGLMGGTRAEMDLSRLLHQRLQLKGLMIRKRSLEDKRAITRRFQERWLPQVASGAVKPVIDSVFPLAEAAAAHQRMEDNANVGKIVLTLM